MPCCLLVDDSGRLTSLLTPRLSLSPSSSSSFVHLLTSGTLATYWSSPPPLLQPYVCMYVCMHVVNHACWFQTLAHHAFFSFRLFPMHQRPTTSSKRYRVQSVSQCRYGCWISKTTRTEADPDVVHVLWACFGRSAIGIASRLLSFDSAHSRHCGSKSGKKATREAQGAPATYR
ncbi:hypothetical protein LX32DRAFT_367870 [Colletotrichum zoysiae]|uniref:Uncharacterized protein n=1 Tax=Colletotrichum zoysiae TaxID=1216348 RepID=A0AAD9HSW1_9PEZI|nr:hypothetical protein LX32DRAFT_367870 [Colletotrichum zoysiae]